MLKKNLALLLALALLCTSALLGVVVQAQDDGGEYIETALESEDFNDWEVGVIQSAETDVIRSIKEGSYDNSRYYNMQKVAGGLPYYEFGGFAGISGKIRVEAVVRSSYDGTVDTVPAGQFYLGFENASGTNDTFMGEFYPTRVTGANGKVADIEKTQWVRVVYTIDTQNKKYNMAVKAIDGTLLGEYAADMPLPGSFDYASSQLTYFRIKSVYLDAAYAGEINLGVDSFKLSRLTPVEKHTITISITGDGRVYAGTQEIADGGTVQVANGGSREFSLTPGAGQEVKSVTANGSDLPVTDHTVKLENVSGDTALSVTFGAVPDEKPALTGTSSVYKTDYDDGTTVYPSATVFTTLHTGNGWQVDHYGVEVQEKGGIVVLPLEVKLKTPDGKYGVKVFGPGLEKGKAYLITPYAVISKDGHSETIHGTPQEFTL